LLGELKEEVRKLYKGNVVYMKRQTNLEHNCMNKFIKPKVDIIINNYTSNIASTQLKSAIDKVNDVTKMASEILEE
jgi:hypothetical protein